MDSKQEAIEFSGYGTVTLTDLLTLSDGETKFWMALSDKITLKELQNGGRRVEDVFTLDNQKFNVLFWKGVLSWLEGCPKLPEMPHFSSLLGRTVQLYLSWDLSDQNIFKILKYLAAGFHKLIKMQDNQQALVALLLKVHQTSEQNETSSFLQLFRMTMERLVRPLGESAMWTPDPKQHRIVEVIKLLDSRDLPAERVMSDVLEIIGSPEFGAAVAEGVWVYWNNRADRRISLVHRVLFKLSALCTCIRTTDVLRAVEKLLITHLLSYNFLQCLISSDLIVFVARLAPAQYVTQLSLYLTELAAITTCTVRASSIRLLLSRLLPLVPQSDSAGLNTKFAKHQMGLLELVADEQTKKRVASSVISSFISSPHITKAGEVVKVLSCSQDPLSLLTTLTQSLLNTPRTRHHQVKLDNLFSLVVAGLEGVREQWKEYRNKGAVLQVFQMLDRLLALNDPVIADITLDVVSKFASFQSSESAVFCHITAQILTKVRAKHPNSGFLQTKCLWVITHFAKMSPHPELLTNLAQNPKLRTLLTEFLKQPKSNHSADVLTTSNTTEISRALSKDAALEIVNSLTTPSLRLVLQSSIDEIRSYPSLPPHARQQLANLAAGS